MRVWIVFEVLSIRHTETWRPDADAISQGMLEHPETGAYAAFILKWTPTTRCLCRGKQMRAILTTRQQKPEQLFWRSPVILENSPERENA